MVLADPSARRIVGAEKKEIKQSVAAPPESGPLPWGWHAAPSRDCRTQSASTPEAWVRPGYPGSFVTESKSNQANSAVGSSAKTPFGLNDLSLTVETVEALPLPPAVVINRAGIGDKKAHEFCQRRDIPIRVPEILPAIFVTPRAQAELPQFRGRPSIASRTTGCTLVD